MPTAKFYLSSPLMDLVMERRSRRLALHHFSLAKQVSSYVRNNSRLFMIQVNQQRFSARNLILLKASLEESTADCRYLQANFAGPGFEVVLHLKVYTAAALLEMWPVIHNTGPESCQIGRVDSFSFDLRTAGYQILSFDSDWGQEFQPRRQSLVAKTILETRLGRSSKGMHPWFALFQEQGGILSGSIAWSGNWIARFEPLKKGGYRISGGLHDWNFGKELPPSASMECPHCIFVPGKDLNEVSQQYARVGRQNWYPRNALSAQTPVEWNHWWSYEDIDINEERFDRNSQAAAALGVQVVTLDAGWFGASDAGSAWYDYRGDWRLVNRQRFPGGIRALSDQAHARGLQFGLWCEIEGLGKKARLNLDHPEFPAARDGKPLGYVCLGNPAAQEWAYQVLCHLIDDNHCDWIKLDFNLDPLAGCNRSDHGHGKADGLFEHYRGYYRLLDRIRQAFPNVLLENCSSGGLRIDLGMLRHTHLAFLSDPDWPVHSLQVFWGASTMLAANACLHWSFSEWRDQNLHPRQNFNPRRPDLTPSQLDYYTRIAMLGSFGLSQKLPDLPDWVAGRLAYHVKIYREQVQRFVHEADLYRLTGQPRRDGAGERWCAFQYSLPAGDRHLLFVFRLPGADKDRPIRLLGLHPQKVYSISGFDGEIELRQSGSELMDAGLVFAELPEEGSMLMIIYPLLEI